MSNDSESIDEELSALTEQHMKFVQREFGIQFLHQAEEVEYRFSTLPVDVCGECGKEYRITHFCEISNARVWKPSWRKDLVELFHGS